MKDISWEGDRDIFVSSTPLDSLRGEIQLSTPEKNEQAPRKFRRTNLELFMDELKKLSGKDNKFVSNTTLRNTLGWEEERYGRVKAELLQAERISTGRGKGGTVGLPKPDAPRPLGVFISYSHHDEGIMKDLVKHLSPLKRQNIISEWHDRKLEAGDVWKAAISLNLQNADIIILIISIDFINSEYCYDIEMDKALERQDQGSAIVIPVIARSCMWKDTRFSHLQAIPTDGKAIASWPDRDEALCLVAESIRDIAKKLHNKANSPTTPPN